MPVVDVQINGRSRAVLDPLGQPFKRTDADPDEGWLDKRLAIPHVTTLSGLLGGASRTYWHDRWDEALRDSRESARVMRRDAFLMGLLQERKLAVTSLPWHLEVPDEKDPQQVQVRDTLTQVLSHFVGFRRVLYALLEALWFGRYACQFQYQWRVWDGQRVLTPTAWLPIHGDKLGWQYSTNYPYVMVNPALVDQLPRADLIFTTSGGYGLLLKGTWRERVTIHKADIEDADYFEPDVAGRIHGVGIRDRIFWLDFIRRDYLEWITTHLERVGLGVVLWYYDASNPEAKQKAAEAAERQSRRCNLLVPLWPDSKGGHKGGVEVVDVPVQGVNALAELLNSICESKIERYFVGQEASSKSQSSGLGNEASAEFQWDTKSKIVAHDANLLGESVTGTDQDPGLLWVLQNRTWPGLPFQTKFVFDIEKANSEKRLQAGKTLWDMGVALKADELRSAAGFSKPAEGDELVQNPQFQQGAQGAPGGGGPPGAGGAAGGMGGLMAALGGGGGGAAGGPGQAAPGSAPGAEPPEAPAGIGEDDDQFSQDMPAEGPGSFLASLRGEG